MISSGVPTARPNKISKMCTLHDVMINRKDVTVLCIYAFLALKKINNADLDECRANNRSTKSTAFLYIYESTDSFKMNIFYEKHSDYLKEIIYNVYDTNDSQNLKKELHTDKKNVLLLTSVSPSVTRILSSSRCGLKVLCTWNFFKDDSYQRSIPCNVERLWGLALSGSEA